ncbi:unnamed protein product [Peniophora sp. CBMAI 1063]|nr:unnamed protein product [Peniophora sp. CBMAI 1063]
MLSRCSLTVLASLSLSAVCRAAVVFTQKEPSLASLAPGKKWEGDGWSYTDCSMETDVVQVSYASVSPEPPKAGQNHTITVRGTVLGTIEEGAYVDVVVKLGLIKVYQHEFDLCDEARNAETEVQCPVKQGEYEIVQQVTLPSQIPPAKITVNVRGFTADEEDMMCGDLMVNFSPRRGSP